MRQVIQCTFLLICGLFKMYDYIFLTFDSFFRVLSLVMELQPLQVRLLRMSQLS